MENIIQIEKLNFSFNGKDNILNDIDLTIKKGDFLAILGASGSGKSTLLRVVSNILPASKKDTLKGKVSIFGKTPKDYLNTGKLSFMFQEASLMPNLSVRENIGFPLKLRGEKVNDILINELLDVVGLTNHQTKYPSELSGGMKTRVSLARAFVTQPEVLLLDEPFSALDISWRYELYSYLVKVASKFNTTVILVTHDIQESVLLGDDIAIFSKKGEILDAVKPIKEKITDFGYEDVNYVLENNTQKILDIQTKIIVDGKRQLTKKEALFLLDKLTNELEITKSDIDNLQGLKPYINDNDIFQRVKDLWNSSNNWELKRNLMWRILDADNASFDLHKSAYNFIFNDWNKFSHKCLEQGYSRKSEIIHNTIQRLNDNKYPSEKDWLYLTYLKAMSQGDKDLEVESLRFISSYLRNSKDSKYNQLIVNLLKEKSV